MSSGELHTTFLDGAKGRLFAIARKPPRHCDGVLFVPPFAEEMNKSRHVFTEIALRLVERGMGSVLVDLHGTGDSEGEFASTDWQGWVTDLTAAFKWAAALGIRVNRLLALRLGCALAAQAAVDNEWRLERSVFIQPLLGGARALDQFLRVRVAASLMQKDDKETVSSLRAKLKAGEAVEVAGYDVSPTLAAQVDAVDLSGALTAALGPIQWIELVRTAGMLPSTLSLKTIENVRKQGIDVALTAVQGEPFWSSAEIVRIPELVDQSVAALGVGA